MGAVGSDYVDPETEPLRQALAWQPERAAERAAERGEDRVRELEKQIWSLRNEKNWWRDWARQLQAENKELKETQGDFFSSLVIESKLTQQKERVYEPDKYCADLVKLSNKIYIYICIYT